MNGDEGLPSQIQSWGWKSEMGDHSGCGRSCLEQDPKARRVSGCSGDCMPSLSGIPTTKLCANIAMHTANTAAMPAIFFMSCALRIAFLQSFFYFILHNIIYILMKGNIEGKLEFLGSAAHAS